MTKYLRSNQASLYLDNLLLTGKTTDAAGNVFTIKAQAADATWGNPVPIDVAVERWMTDGAIASTQGYENREPSFKVIISADTSVALAAGEAALIEAAIAATALAWVSPEGTIVAPTTVFELWTVHLDHEFDLDQENRLSRGYTVNCTAKPWARSENLTLAAANPTAGAPTTVLIDACASTTGWTGVPSAPTTSGGAVKETAVIVGGVGSVLVPGLTRAGSVTGFGATPFLQLNMAATGGTVLEWIVKVDGLTCTKVAQIGPVSYWTLPGGKTSFTSLNIQVAVKATRNSGNVVLSVADVSQTDTIGGIGSHKQLIRNLAVGGSVPTAGSIAIAAPSATPLGTCLVYTCPDDGSGYTPPLRQFRTSGNTVTADATCVSGNHEAFVTAGASAGTITFTIPPPLLPEASYVVVGRLIPSATQTVSITLQTAFQSVTGKLSAVTTIPFWGVIGVLSLPPLSLPPESQIATVVTVSATSTTGNVLLDELYLLDVTHGAFSLVLAAATNHTMLWIDAPDVNPAKNRPAIYIGTQADRSDAISLQLLQLLSMGAHELDPGGTIMLTVTDAEDDATANVSFYHRWHTHAGD